MYLSNSCSVANFASYLQESLNHFAPAANIYKMLLMTGEREAREPGASESSAI